MILKCKCGEEVERKNFTKNPICFECQREYARQYTARTRGAAQKKYARKRQEKLRIIRADQEGTLSTFYEL